MLFPKKYHTFAENIIFLIRSQTMKKITAILFLTIWIFPIGGIAQNALSSKMSMLLEYCLRVRTGVENADADELIDCISQWQPGGFVDNVLKKEKFIYKDTLMNFVPFGQVEDVDISQEIPLGTHLKFTPAQIDTLIANDLEPVDLADAHVLRTGTYSTEIPTEYLVRAVKEKGKATYSVPAAAGKAEIFVVSENGGAVNLYVNTGGDNVIEDAGGKPSAQLSWQMENKGTIKFTVENTSDKPISFIVVKKM